MNPNLITIYYRIINHQKFSGYQIMIDHNKIIPIQINIKR